ncbi:putative integral membrane protein [Bisgaardia hudsonensis]|uniref:Putative integral membrane protein n=1 Tax=Bisgaardia hudsonensis TaxID=109472 RepID=A0A4R2N2N4_9PAST|nr:DUF2301 domain-containing membrane protein [Bisgaardia hudsonensis]QLB12546.1 hypothetical protein A6A11_02470 [Bisgaardia hudsonensis]TCP14087.1 putative integral membrane protein [Bisgaardia hudsonensis]
MADPHIKSPMDFWDYLTAIIYRSGFVLATIMLIYLAFNQEIAQIGLLISATMLASSLHLYMKSFRLIFQFAMWIGLFCFIFGLPHLALGATFLTIGGLCYKEYFCFRIFGLNLQPILLAALWLSLTFHIELVSNILIVFCSLLLALLSIQKWRMPLHFDIGDKTKYQI